jgi:hypothetical protein
LTYSHFTTCQNLSELVTGLFIAAAVTIAAWNNEDRMKGLYQWLIERASFFRSDVSSRGTSRTVRTEVTVQREGMTLLVGGVAAGFDICPLCGTELATAEAEQARLRLGAGPISQGTGPVDVY